MMNYFSSKKKWMAYLILLTFVFTCIVPTNLAGGNSVWADTETEVVGTSNIQFTMFDYGSKINLNSAESSDTDFRPIATYFNFRGNTGDNPTGPTPGISNVYDEDGFTRNHATVERVLDEDGYPVLDLTRQADGSNKPALATALSKEARSLAYLFKNGDHAVDVYVATNSLVQETSNNYYEYNSATSAADFNKESGAFTVYANSPERTYATTSYAGGPYGDFLPFNSSNGGTDIKGTNNTHYYHYKASEPNYWYGMTMEATFRQPENGTLNGSQMEFNFSGDDDVWVFIDDVLVLDLGGTHGIVTGSINFATGVINQHINWANDNGTTKKHHWDSTKTVECKAVYHTAACEAADPGHTSSCACPTHTCDEGKNCYSKSYSTDLKTCFDLAGKTPTGGWNTNQTTFADYSTHDIKFFYLERGSGAANCWLNFNIQPIETVDKTVTKVWNDDDNRDGLRTESITVQLLENGQPYDNGSENGRKTLSSGNDGIWQNEELMATWTHLPKYNVNGEEISYTVEEVNVPTGYTCDITTDSALNFIITNTHELELIDISGTKHWVDDENADGLRPDSIEVILLADGKEVQTQKVTSASSWTYEFTDLYKYADGKEITYDIAEAKKVDGYQTIYDINSYDITNIRDDNPALLTDLPVKKIWDDDGNTQGKRPSSITLQLLVNGKTTGSAIEFKPSDSSANEWSYTFTDLPRYGEGGVTNVYTVEEINVPEGYISSMAATMNGVSITNKLFDGNIGEFGVSKEVKDLDGNVLATDKDFTFNLEVNAETAKWTALLVSQRDALLDEKSAAESRVNETDNALKNAVKLFEEHTHVYTTTSAYDFVMTSTPSHYRYTIVDNTGDVFSKTTSSAYDFWGNASEITGDGKDGIVTKIIEAVKELAKQFERLTNPASFLQKLWAKVEKDIHDDASVAMDEEITEELLIAARNNDDAEKQLNVIKDEIEIFNKNIPTTPGAITLVMKADNGTEKTLDLSPEASNKYFDGKVYTIPFMLKNGEDMRFAMKTTTGTAVSYVVKEVLTDDVKNINGYNYQYTDINNVRTLETTTQNLTKDTEFKGFWFINWYDKPDDPWTPTTPDPKDPPPPPEKTNPDTTIPDENIPTGSVEPGEPLDEPEIPLGDAPATGDTNNAAPFMVLLLAAIAGLVITRRKFN